MLLFERQLPLEEGHPIRFQHDDFHPGNLLVYGALMRRRFISIVTTGENLYALYSALIMLGRPAFVRYRTITRISKASYRFAQKLGKDIYLSMRLTANDSSIKAGRGPAFYCHKFKVTHSA